MNISLAMYTTMNKLFIICYSIVLKLFLKDKSKNSTLFYVQATEKCNLHSTSKYPDAARKDPEDLIDKCKPYQQVTPLAQDNCEWKRFLLYAIPLVFYIPWAIRKMRCSPKCCPQISCCPNVKCVPEQNTCCPPNPASSCEETIQPKQQKDFRCGKDKKACSEGSAKEEQ